MERLNAYNNVRNASSSPTVNNDRQILIFHCVKIPHCFLIIVSNTFLITALILFKSLKRHTRHYFTLNLAVSDFSMGAEGLLHSASYFFRVPPSHPVVHAETFLLKTTVHASLLTFLIIAVIECRAVEAPLITELTKSKCLTLIAFLWTVSVALGGTATYIKAVDSSTYLRVKQFELTFYLATSLVICAIYAYIFWLIETRRTKFDFYDPRRGHPRPVITSADNDNRLRVSVSSVWAANSENGSNRSSLKRTFTATSRLSSLFDTRLGGSGELSTKKAGGGDGLRVSSGRQQFYNTRKAAVTAAVITFTFMACFIPYIVFYARNLLAFVNETVETTVQKYYINGIVFTVRSLLNPLIQIFRTTEIRQRLAASCVTAKRKLTEANTININNNNNNNSNFDLRQRTRL